MFNKTKGVIVKKLLLIGTILIATACTPSRDEVRCTGHTLSSCKPAVYFDFNSSKIDTKNELYSSNFDWVAKKLKDWPDRTVTLIGHTDLKGRQEYNSALSGRRAAAIQEQLILRGVDPNRINIEAMGMVDPLTEEENKQDLNRRVDITFGHKNRTFFQACKDVWYDLFVEEEETEEVSKPVETVKKAPAKVEEVKKDVEKTKTGAKKDVKTVKADAKKTVAEVKTDVQKDAKEIKQDIKDDVKNIKEDAKKDVDNVQSKKEGK